MSKVKKVEIKFKHKKDTLIIKLDDEKISTTELIALYTIIESILSKRLINEEFLEGR